MGVSFPINFFWVNPNIWSEINVVTEELFYFCLIYIKREAIFLDEKCSMFLLENTETNYSELPVFPFYFESHWSCSLTGNHKRLVLLSKCILWLIHYFIGGEGETGKSSCYTKCFGLFIACLTAVICSSILWSERRILSKLELHWMSGLSIANDTKNEPVTQPYFNFPQCLIGGNWVFWLNILFKKSLKYQITVSSLHCVQ